MDIKTCPFCGKELITETQFCEFCGKKFQDVQCLGSSKKTEATRSFKQISFVILFLLYLTFSYSSGMGNLITDFYNRSIELDVSLSEFQINFIDSLIPIFDLIFSTFFVGLFAYWFKGLKSCIYLSIGILMKYWLALLVMGWIIFQGRFSRGELSSLFGILIIQIIAVIIGSFIGVKIASKYPYINKKDKTNFFFYGLSKKFWFLITIAYNPILQFVSKLSVYSFYTASKSITDTTNWLEFFTRGYVWGVLITLLIPFVAFAVSLKLFSIGIQAVKNKKTKYRKYKIIIFLIVLPLMAVLIPIIRNRTWFF